MSPAWPNLRTMGRANDRSVVTDRRKRLRLLDVVLCGELEDAGGLTFNALRQQVSRELMSTAVSDDTLWEWWHYARRRRIVEPGPSQNEMALSDRGRVALSEARREATPVSAPKARAVLQYLVPSGIIGLVAVAVGIVSANVLVAVGVAIVIGVVLLYWLLAEVTDRLFAKYVNPQFQRAELKAYVAWLDGKEVRWLGRVSYEAVDATRIKRLDTPELPPDLAFHHGDNFQRSRGAGHLQ